VSVDLYDTLYGGAKELAVLYPVPWTANPNYSIEGATSVIYDASGGNPSYYKKPYKLFDNGVEVEGINW
jgi:hypothetical protein